MKPSFITISVPRMPWFQRLLKGVIKSLSRDNKSLSNYLIRLTLRDLVKRELIETSVVNNYEKTTGTGGPKTRPIEKQEHSVFSLYIPKDLLDVVKTNVKVAAGEQNVSSYIWDLLVQDNKGKVSIRLQEEWELYFKSSHVGRPKSTTTPKAK